MYLTIRITRLSVKFVLQKNSDKPVLTQILVCTASFSSSSL